MAGWVAFLGAVDNYRNRLDRFKKVFALENMPALSIKEHMCSDFFKAFSWAWNEREIPDIHYAQCENKAILLAGVITDWGDVGISFESSSEPSKVLLRSWKELGKIDIGKLNGSFSIIAWNGESKVAEIYTDRFASRSVWMGKEKNIWILGNFPSAIAACMESNLKLDPAGLWSFFHAGRQVGNRSLYSNINCLMAGQKATLSPDHESNISCWWKRKYVPHKDITPREWGFLLARAIERSANRYKKVSPKAHLFLSGGLDSRIVAAGFRSPLKTLTICTFPNSETRIASWVSKILGLEHENIFRSLYWYLENTEAAGLISSGIYLNHHAHFITPVKRFLEREPGAVFLLGDLMENFNKHYFSEPKGITLRICQDNLTDLLFSSVPYTIKNYRSRRGKLFHKEIRNILEEQYVSSLKQFADSVMDVSDSDEDRFDTLLRWSNVGLTPTYNMITCIWPLAGERNIYFDNDLDSLSLHIPSSLRGKSILHRWILFHLNKILLMIPDANTFLPSIVPKAVADFAKKMRPLFGTIRRGGSRNQQRLSLRTSGSWLLLHELYRKNRLYKYQIEKLILRRGTFSPDLFDMDEIRKIWKEYLNGNIAHHFEIEALRTFGSLNCLLPFSRIEN